jgi:hypothetical protein
MKLREKSLQEWKALSPEEQKKFPPHTRPYGAFPHELKRLREIEFLWWNALSPEEKAEVPPGQRPPSPILSDPTNEANS